MALPDNSPEWSFIHDLLTEAQHLFEQGQLGFHHLRTAAQLLHKSASNDGAHVSRHKASHRSSITTGGEDGTVRIEPVCSVFHGLERFVLTQCNPQTQYRILTLTLPTIIRYALTVPSQGLSNDISANTAPQATGWSLSLAKFSCLLACGMLGLLRPTPDMTMIAAFCSRNLFGDLSRPEHYERLQSVLRFFDSVADSSKLSGNVHFIHKRGPSLADVTPTDWLQCDTPLCTLKVHCTPQTCRTHVQPEEIILYPVGKKQCGYCPELEVSHSVMQASKAQEDPSKIYCHQVSKKDVTDVIICSVHTPRVAAPITGLTELERCQIQIFNHLEELLACYTGHQEACSGLSGTNDSGENLAIFGQDLLSQTTCEREAACRLLAFSQQLSENILNEAVQISTNRGPSSVGARPKVSASNPRHVCYADDLTDHQPPSTTLSSNTTSNTAVSATKPSRKSPAEISKQDSASCVAGIKRQSLPESRDHTMKQQRHSEPRADVIVKHHVYPETRQDTAIRHQIYPEPQQDIAVRHQTSRQAPQDFVNIPVEVEFGDVMELDIEREKALGPPSSDGHFPDNTGSFQGGLGPPPFKKILLVEEEQDNTGQPFVPHSVHGACIVEESSREPSPSDSSADSTTPATPSNGVPNLSHDVPQTDNAVDNQMDVESSNGHIPGSGPPNAPSDLETSLIHSFADEFVKNLFPSAAPLEMKGDASPDENNRAHINDAPSEETSRHGLLSGVSTGLGLPSLSLAVVPDMSQGSRQGPEDVSLQSAALQDDTDHDERCQNTLNELNISEENLMTPTYFRSAVEDMVDRMLSIAFHSGYEDIQTRKDSNMTVQTNDVLKEYVCGLIDDTFDAAMYEIREYIAEISRPEGCRSVRVMGGLYLSDKALDREWNAQLTAFVDDFVMNVMEEALYISKTQNPEPRRKERRLHSCRSTETYSRVPSIQENELPVPTLGQSIGATGTHMDSKYFEVEFAVDFHNSRLNENRRGSGASSSRSYLRADHSSGSSRRGSNEDENIRLGWRRGSVGFRDSVLSEFEDELVHSDISTPSFNMFAAESVDVQSKRRASEPSSRRRVSSDVQTKLNKKRARSVDSTTSRKVILQWLDSQSSSSSSNLSASSRKRTSSSHLDWFAQDLLVEAFNDAFVSMFGRNYEGLSEQEHLEFSECSKMIPTSLVHFADSLSQAVLQESYHDIAVQTGRASSEKPESVGDEFYSVSDSQEEYMDALDVPISQLEAIADSFSSQIIMEAIEIFKQDLHRYAQTCILYIIHDTQIQLLLRWVGATRAAVPAVVCCTLGSTQLKQLSTVVRLLQSHHYSVADLVHLVFAYLEEQAETATEETPFAFIISRLGEA